MYLVQSYFFEKIKNLKYNRHDSMMAAWTPSWAKGVQVSAAGGGVGKATSSGRCGC